MYERRCDLSPSGDKLLYFAATHSYQPHEDDYSWTGVSKPPYFSAIYRWPKGDSWSGGGLFENENKILLNHHCSISLADGYRLNEKEVSVERLGLRVGEDNPIYRTRLIRDGWILNETSSVKTYEKTHPQSERQLIMKQIEIKGWGKYWWCRLDFEVQLDHETILSLPNISWADWDKNGDLLFADEGRLYRLKNQAVLNNAAADKAMQIADFSNLTFKKIPPPEDATKW